jgi:O-antigen/teichoic acid export membrane protein
MTLQSEKLANLIDAVQAISPELADFWQATAIIESLGYTDPIIAQEFDFPDALSLGKYVYEHHKPCKVSQQIAPAKSLKQKILEQLQIFISQFSRSFLYAIPLLAILLLEYIHIGKSNQLLPPKLASLITLATMASLTISGGFVQMISRRGEFYLNLGEPIQGRRVCLPILYLGTFTSIILGLVAVWLGFYQGLFLDEYLMLAALYYLGLSLLWMLLAVLSVQLPSITPLVLVGVAAIFLTLRVGVGINALEAQMLTMGITLLIVLGLILFEFNKNKKTEQLTKNKVKLPRLSALIYLLAPYFFYGIAYFSFIFADRIVAGWAIDPASGLVFAVSANYQKSMDLALINFLVLVPLVEYLSYQFIKYWYLNSVNITSDKIKKYSGKLFSYYRLIIISVVICFTLFSWLIFHTLKPHSWEVKENSLLICGCLGYLFFVLGLLNAILLFSINQALAVVRTIIPSLILNITLGYILANAVSSDWAVIGLLSGAVMFMLLSTKQVVQGIKQPDYVYYLSGY